MTVGSMVNLEFKIVLTLLNTAVILVWRKI